jgi:PAS domain S-box-containing protein
MVGDELSGERVQGEPDRSTLELLPLHSTDLLTLLDESGIIQYESPSIERLYGFDQAELVGEQVAEYFHPEDRKRVLGAFEAVVESDGQQVEAVEYRHQMADGSYRWIESVASSNPTPEGHYVVNSRDISERKQRERELEAARERAQSERDGKEAIRQLLLQSSTDDEIASSVCRLLVDTYGYEAAWLVRNHDTGVDTNLNPLWLAEYGSDRGFRPGDGDSGLTPDAATRRALSTDESVCVTAASEGEQQPADRLRDCGLHSVRAVPLEHDGISHGVLTVVRESEEDEYLKGLVSELATALAFKQQVNRQQDALVAETVTEIEVSLSGEHLLGGLSTAPPLPDGVVLTAEELGQDDPDATYLVKAAGVDGETLERAASELPDAQDTTLVTETETTAVVQIQTGRPTLGTLLGKYGGIVQSLTARDGRVTLCVQFPRRTGLGVVAEAVHEHWPGARIRSRNDRSVETNQPVAFESLTQKQEDALRAATLAGFFERPQRATAADVAQTLDVSQSTFLHHLRNAEHEVFQQTFADESG